MNDYDVSLWVAFVTHYMPRSLPLPLQGTILTPVPDSRAPIQ